MADETDLETLDPGPQEEPTFVPDETEPAADQPPVTATPAAGEPAQVQPRGEHGHFAQKIAAARDGVVAAPVTESEPVPEPQFAPFSITVDKQTVPIPGVESVSADGHTMLVYADAQAERVQQLLGRGVMYEKTEARTQERAQLLTQWQQHLQEQANAPRPPTDDEIEAKVILEVLKPKLPDLFNEAELAWLNDKVRLAKFEQQGQFRDAATAQQSQTQEAAQTDQFHSMQLAAWIDNLSKLPEYKGLIGDEEKSEIFDLILPTKGSFFQVMNEKAPLNQRYGFHDDWLKKQLDFVASRIKRERDHAAAQTKAHQFNARNAANGNIPPAPGKRVTPKSSGVPEKYDRKTFDQAAFIRGDYHPDQR